MSITSTSNTQPFNKHTGIRNFCRKMINHLNPFSACMKRKNIETTTSVATDAHINVPRYTHTQSVETEQMTPNSHTQSVETEQMTPNAHNQSVETADTQTRVMRSLSVYQQAATQEQALSPQTYHERALIYLAHAKNEHMSDPDRTQAFNNAIDYSKFAISMGCEDSVDLLCNFYRSGLTKDNSSNINLVEPDAEQLTFWNNVKTKLKIPTNSNIDFDSSRFNDLTPREVKMTRFIQLSSSINERSRSYPIEHAQQYYSYMKEISSISESHPKGRAIPGDVWNTYNILKHKTM